MRRLVRSLLRNRRVLWLGKRLYTYFLDDIRQVLNENPDITEINSIPVRPSDEPGLRFNLMIPAVSERHIFGGIATGLQFFEGFKGLADDFRIIATDEGRLRDNRMDMSRFPGWTFTGTEEADRPGRLLVSVGRRQGSLPLRANDVFISTAWWSAHLARELIAEQQRLHGVERRRFIYLIQDYEPLFYPWSARYALAKQTYHDPDGYVPVFNSALLRDYLVNLGLAQREDLFFHPIMNHSLQAAVRRLGSLPRERQVLVYGRPSVDRNAYELIVRGLRRLVATHDVSGWRFISAGEPHASVQLGHGLRLEARGKLSIDAYARELLRSHVGVSLMISPHPSYPPLEMAATGMRVITNQYANKDLSSWAANIQSIDVADADQLVGRLADAIAEFGKPAPSGPPDPAFQCYLEAQSDFSALARAAWERTRV